MNRQKKQTRWRKTPKRPDMSIPVILQWADVHFANHGKWPDALATQEQLKRILDAHSLACGVIIGSTGRVVVQAGDFETFASQGLVSTILGPSGSTETTYELVQNQAQSKPVIWQLGDEYVILECAAELVIAVFGRDQGDLNARLEFSRRVGDSIVATLASATASPHKGDS